MESQTPPDSKPPAQRPASPPEKPWISPRLRDKLDEAESGAPKEGSSPLVGIVLAFLVIGGGAALFVTMRSGAAKQKAEATLQAAAAGAAAVAESTLNAARIDSMRTVVAARAAAESAQAGLRTPSSSGATAAATSGSSASSSASKPASHAASAPAAHGESSAPAPPKVVEKGPFGLDVGTFLADDRASSELTRFSSATGLQGKVITRNEDGGEAYHVVLGSFATRAAADKRAESLVTRALVNQARTVSLAP